MPDECVYWMLPPGKKQSRSGESQEIKQKNKQFQKEWNLQWSWVAARKGHQNNLLSPKKASKYYLHSLGQVAHLSVFSEERIISGICWEFVSICHPSGAVWCANEQWTFWRTEFGSERSNTLPLLKIGFRSFAWRRLAWDRALTTVYGSEEAIKENRWHKNDYLHLSRFMYVELLTWMKDGELLRTRIIMLQLKWRLRKGERPQEWQIHQAPDRDPRRFTVSYRPERKPEKERC